MYDALGNDKDKEAIIAVSDIVDANKNPIVVVVRPNGKGQLEAEPVDSNFIATMYGHENIDNQIYEALKQNKLLFIDKNKSQTLSPFAGLQLSRALDNSDSNGIIHPSSAIVKSSETWLGSKDTINSEPLHDNVTAKDKLLSKAQTVSKDVSLCNKECKLAETKVYKTVENIKQFAVKVKEKIKDTFDFDFIR